MDSTTLTEHCHNWNQDLSVDQEQRIVQNVALTGIQSRNGYQYSESSLRNAVKLYEGKPVFLDHAPNRMRPHERSTRDLVGSITNASFTENRIRGDIRVLETESGQTFLKLLEIESPGVGMSHVVSALKSADGTTVEQITDVLSVDVVVNPATTSTFRESISNDLLDVDTNSETEEPDSEYRQRILDLQAQHALLEQRNTDLKTLVGSLQSENQVHKLLAQARLPDRAVTNFFVQQLRNAPDESTRKQLIQDRLTLVTSESAERPRVQSQERFPTAPSAPADDQFIHAIRRK